MSLVLVLCYHGISSTWPSPTAIPAERLEEQLRLFLDDGYRGATFTEAVLAPPAERTLAVTFDDAYRSIFERAAPVLEQLGLPGTLFVPTDRLGRGELLAWPTLDDWIGAEHETEIEPMTWDEIDTLARAGWEIGAHTVSHPHLPTLEDEALFRELADAKDECEARLGRPCSSVAYPYGEADARVVAAVARAGFVTGAGLYVEEPQALHWPRVCVSALETSDNLHRRSEPLEVSAAA